MTRQYGVNGIFFRLYANFVNFVKINLRHAASMLVLDECRHLLFTKSTVYISLQTRMLANNVSIPNLVVTTLYGFDHINSTYV